MKEYTNEEIEIIEKHCLVIIDYIYNHNEDVYAYLGGHFENLFILKGKDLKNFIWNNRGDIINYLLSYGTSTVDDLILDALTTYEYLKTNSSILINKNKN